MVQAHTCPLCLQTIAPSDRVLFERDRQVHVNCRLRRAQNVRDRATELVKTSEQLRARADLLTRDAEVSIAEARRLVRDGIANGTLPGADGAPPTIVGVTGDGSLCAACGQAIRSRRLMVTITRSASAVQLHAYCFEAWNAETDQQP